MSTSPCPPASGRQPTLRPLVDRILATGPQPGDGLSPEQFAYLSRLHRWHCELEASAPAPVGAQPTPAAAAIVGGRFS